ncbi:MAG: MgtC/SapB family protein [Chloroflexota bacterium]|nr:MgtC/SapB family protein [Chloroflexota bacterium]
MDEASGTLVAILVRLLAAAVIGAMIGYERRLYYKAIGVASMILVSVGSASYIMLATYLADSDPEAIGRAIQGVVQGVGFLGAGAIFKGGTDVRGIKTAATIWITGAIGMSLGTSFWQLGLTIGLGTALVLVLTDFLPALGSKPQLIDDASQHRRER